MQHLTARSFAISLTVVLVTIRAPASCFTIRRIEPSGPASDLVAEENALLEVKYDLHTFKSSTDGKADESNTALNESTSTEINTNVTIESVTEFANNSENPTINVSEKFQNESTNQITLIRDAINHTTLASTFPDTVELTSIYENPTLQTVNIYDHQSIEQTPVTPSVNLDNYTFKLADYNNTTTDLMTEQSLNYASQTLKYNENENHKTENMNNIKIEQDPPMAITRRSVSADDAFLTEVLSTTPHSISNKFSRGLFNQLEDNTVSSSINPASYIALNTDTNFVYESSTLAEESFKVTMIDFATDKSEMYLMNDAPTDIVQSVKGDPTTSVPPNWTTYKTAEINRSSTASSDESTRSGTNLNRGETEQTTIGNMLTYTSRLPIIKQKFEISKIQEHTTNINEPEHNFRNASEFKRSTEHVLSTVALLADTHATISSKRGGYLDNTETTTSIPIEATTAQYANKDKANDKDSFGSMYETEGGEAEGSDTLEIKNVTGIESQSQLVEDAIKEELLMEKTLHENEYMKETAQLMGSKSGTTVPDITLAEQQVITEDVLSVKPINIEKNRKNVLYSISSSYRPLKKLDIQPVKQYNRDPDDNSWRNERISSLGIVFKPKNASKSFTEVLKNKTTELNNVSEKNEKSNIPELRERLEKIAEVRKSKKKKIGVFGDTVYNDYEESSNDTGNTSLEVSSPMTPPSTSLFDSTPILPPSSTTAESSSSINDIHRNNFKLFKDEFSTPKVAPKNKMDSLRELYDSGDDYDADYVTKIDLKKFSTPATVNNFKLGSQDVKLNTKISLPVTYMPDRQPTIQYFPPTKRAKTTVNPEVLPRVNFDEYDIQFKDKVNELAFTHPPTVSYDFSYGTVSPMPTKKIMHQGTDHPKQTHKSLSNNVEDISKTLYITNQPRLEGGFVPSNGNRASYVIKHYKDFIVDALKGSEDEHYPFTLAPIQYVKMDKIDDISTPKESIPEDDYDYHPNFRKDIVNKFVENFNQNSDKFKVDFPILYNNSVVHRKVEENSRVPASSSTFVKRLYEAASPRTNFLSNVKPCDISCESMRVVDLSPAYELHYYVPEQEEKEVIEHRHHVLPHRFRL